MIINQLSPVVPEKLTWEEWWADFGGILLGSSLIAGGLLGAWATKKYFKKENQIYGYVGSAALGGFGAYKIYTALKKEEAEPALPDERYPIAVINPYPGEKWLITGYHCVKVNVSNPYSVSKKVFIGMSMLSEKTGMWFDFPVKELVISPNVIEECKWCFWGRPDGQTSGIWHVVAVVWDVFPVPPCEEQGTCHRLGEAESWCDISLF